MVRNGWIYRYYAYLINERYNQRVRKDGIDSVAVAYRTNLGKSNIDFAKEAFQYIRGTTSCYVMIGDFTDFFDNLDHVYLKNQLCDLLSVEKLPDDGLSGKSDEEKLGFSYSSLDRFIREGVKDDNFEKIKKMHDINMHKRNLQGFNNNFKNYFDREN